MPSHDRTALNEIGGTHLPLIRDAMNNANVGVSDTSGDWGAPFAERGPDGWGEIYANTNGKWVDARNRLQRILEKAAINTDEAARLVLKASANYLAAEEAATQRLQDIQQRFS